MKKIDEKSHLTPNAIFKFGTHINEIPWYISLYYTYIDGKNPRKLGFKNSLRQILWVYDIECRDKLGKFCIGSLVSIDRV